MEALFNNVGVAARASRLVEDEVRRRGLRGGALPFGEDDEGARWPRREGELPCGEAGSAVEEAVAIESR